MNNVNIDNVNKKKNTKPHIAIIVILVLAIISLGIIIYNKQKEIVQASENKYNMAFFEVVNYVENVETYLAKSLITKDSKHSAETLTNLWREADLAHSYLSMLPINTKDLENTSKFLNQVSDYSFSLSRKNIDQEDLSEEELANLKQLHEYSIQLENTLNQLSRDLTTGKIHWGELENKGNKAFAQQVDNISQDSFDNIEENFHEYSGLIYDGAFSEHLTGQEKKGLTGENITEDDAKNISEKIIGKDKIKQISEATFSENANIPAYDIYVTGNNDENINISISKKGGHLIYLNSNRDTFEEKLSYEQVNQIGKEYLNSIGFKNMKETYYIKQEGVITINYAYTQNDVVIYSDLIKVKIALDNGEVLGVETTGYLNNHEERKLVEPKITPKQAKANLNKELNILSEGLAIIPTKWQSEIYCYEFKGKIKDTEFLVYINAENGREEDILVIKETPNGVLTM